jgi:hypothetical protein
MYIRQVDIMSEKILYLSYTKHVLPLFFFFMVLPITSVDDVAFG